LPFFAIFLPFLIKIENIIFTAFGAGFTWGAMFLKWGYNS